MTLPHDAEWLAWSGSVGRQARPRQAVPEPRVRDQRASDWAVILIVFGPGALGVFCGAVAALRWAGWEGL